MNLTGLRKELITNYNEAMMQKLEGIVVKVRLIVLLVKCYEILEPI